MYFLKTFAKSEQRFKVQ